MVCQGFLSMAKNRRETYSEAMSGEFQKTICDVCEGSGQVCSFKGVSRFAMSWEDCPICGGIGFLVSTRDPDEKTPKAKNDQKRE
jgi:hypothetical protein